MYPFISSTHVLSSSGAATQTRSKQGGSPNGQAFAGVQSLSAAAGVSIGAYVVCAPAVVLVKQQSLPSDAPSDLGLHPLALLLLQVISCAAAPITADEVKSKSGTQ